MPAMKCPVEKRFEELLDARGIKYTRPEKDANDKSSVDYFLKDYDLYVEVKQFHTDRVNGQIAKCYPKGVMVLVGMAAVVAFERLLESIDTQSRTK